MDEPEYRAVAWAIAQAFARPGGNEPAIKAMQSLVEVLDLACQEQGLEITVRRVAPVAHEDGRG